MSKIGDEEIIELHKKGLTDREIASALGVSQSSVNYRRQRLGLKNNYHNKHKKFDEDKFLELYNLGYTDREIAEKMNLTAPRGYTVQQIAEELKVSLTLVKISLEKASV